MPTVAEILANWQRSLCPCVEAGGLISRNHIAHKWKAPFRSLILRETVFWRVHDLLTQTYELHQAHRALGARIILRSGLETIATLIYLNQAMAEVVEGGLDFHVFSDKTSRLLLGSRNESTKHQAINIITIIEKCEKTYAGIFNLYASLSESAHPNFEGMCFGYSQVDPENYVSRFSNSTSIMYENQLIPALKLCMTVFENEYHNVWPRQFWRLEDWIVANDDILESTKK